jgi:hypothetical protein
MKRVVKDLPIENLVRIEDISPLKVYICANTSCSLDRLWYLRYEDNFQGRGWIFRYWDSLAGMSGHFPTMRDAIDKAYEYGQVLEFESMKEAAKWISDNYSN